MNEKPCIELIGVIEVRTSTKAVTEGERLNVKSRFTFVMESGLEIVIDAFSAQGLRMVGENVPSER